jgi:hypothetical protein
VRIVFRTDPAWTYWVGILTPVWMGCIGMLYPLLLIFFIFHFPGHPNNFNQNVMLETIGVKGVVMFVLVGMIGIACWFIALINWRQYRRFGRVSRTLLADKNGLTYSWLGWFSIRHRYWPVNEITAVEFRPIKRNLDRWNTVADLKILFHGKRSRRFRLSSHDPQLPAKIAERIRAILGLPPT